MCNYIEYRDNGVQPRYVHQFVHLDLRIKAYSTKNRPDLILLSRHSKTLVMAELTVHWEDRLALSHQFKKVKYQDLVDEGGIRGWHAALYPFEVGTRGLPATPVIYCRRWGWITGKLRKATREIATAAESYSRWLGLSRNRSWNPSAGEG